MGCDVSPSGEIGGPRRTTGANAVPSPLPRGGQLAGWRQGPLGFLAQLVRASSLHLECQRFKSVRTQACSNSRRGGAPRTPPHSGRGCRANPLRGVAFCLIAFACDAEKTILIGGLGPQSFGRNNLATFGRKLALGPGRAPAFGTRNGARNMQPFAFRGPLPLSGHRVLRSCCLQHACLQR